MFVQLFIAMRPRQWLKNILLFIPLVFAGLATNPFAVFDVFVGFGIFCVLASAVYLFNDLVDRESDRQHPQKKSRPIASGLLSPLAAKIAAAILGVGSLAVAFFWNRDFAAVAAAYAAWQILYSFWLKKIPIVDFLAVAISFVLRVIAGAVAIDVWISGWLVAVTFLLAAVLAAGKRLRELETTDQKSRKVLDEYSPAFLRDTIKILLAGLLTSYLFYSFQAAVSEWFVATTPIVVFGLLRYLALVDSDRAVEDPTELLLSDRPIQLAVIFWLALVIAIFSFA